MRRLSAPSSTLARALRGTATCGAAVALCLSSLPAWAADGTAEPDATSRSTPSASEGVTDSAASNEADPASGAPGVGAESGSSADTAATTPATAPDAASSAPEDPAQSEPNTHVPAPAEMTAPKPSAVASSDLTPIAEIQKTGVEDDSALIGKTVTTKGVVTAIFPHKESDLSGTKDGFYIQTPGTGGAWDPARTTSDGIFVYVGKSKMKLPEIGQCVTVKGTVAEYVWLPKKNQEILPSHQSLTQLTRPKVTVESGCDPVMPTPLTGVPTEAQKEALEGMLVQPQGTWTITDNYNANVHGTLTLTPGTEPLKQATDVVAPGDEARQYEAVNAARAIILDDGNITYLTRGTAREAAYAYLSNAMPARVGYHVTFTKPVLMDTREQVFVFQPTQMAAGHPDRSPVTISGERPAAPTVDGAVKVATFNVLNYFIHLGEDEKGCKAYKDRDGNGLSTDNCKTARGAHSRAAFENQQTKIVQAINALNADVVGLEEIENGARFDADRDAALKALVKALNDDLGADVWAPVLSPATVPEDEDVIRVAFIYKKAVVSPVGESKILDHEIFTGLARQPLAQEFAPVVTDAQEGTNFVVIANHFKSKGRVSNVPGMNNNDTGDGQGNNNPLRVAQAKALAAFAEQFADKPTLLVGDFNSYTKEDPIRVLTEAGWVHKSGEASASYVYGGRVGSLDHVLANAAADKLVAGVASWALNAHESVAFEYSRANTNAHLKFEADNPYRSSDHNPELVGLNVIKDKKVEPQPQPTPNDPKDDQPKGDEPKGDEPKGDEPKGDEPKGDAPKDNGPKTDQPKGDEPKGDQPKTDAPKTDQPKGDQPKTDAPKTDQPKSDQAQTDMKPQTGQKPSATPGSDAAKKSEAASAPAAKKATNGKLAATGAHGLPLVLAAAALTAAVGVSLVLRRRS